MAFGPVVALSTGLGRGVAPDSWHTGAFIVLAIWVLIITVLSVSVPAWIGRWADAWQQRDRRVPARGGMAIAAVGAWVTLAVGLYLVIGDFTFVDEFSASTKTVLEQYWTSFGYDAARTWDAWVICLVFIAVPLTGYLTSLRRRPARAAGDTARRPRTWLERGRPVALICLAGLVAEIAVTLVTAAVARARIAPAVRWNGVYFADFVLDEEQIVILVAVIVALAAAAMLACELSDTIAIAVGAVTGAFGILAMTGSLTLGNCAAAFSPTYDHTPANDCPGYPGWLAPDIFPAAIEAALIGILVIPAAHYGGILIARRARLGGRPRRRGILLRWLAAGVAAAAVIAGIAVQVPDASAHGIRPVGSIGQDGWVYGTGYEIRIFPNWYDFTPSSDRGDIVVAYDGSFSGTFADLTLETVRVSAGATIRGKGGRAFLLDGARGLTFVYPDIRGYFNEQWLVIRGYFGYVLTFRAVVANHAFFESNITTMLNSWHWSATTSSGPSSSSPAPSPTSVFAIPAIVAQLTQALLPVQALGTAAAVRSSGTNLSDVVALCGVPLPSGAQLTAYETLQDGQIGQYLEEIIVEWDNPGDAATLISNAHAALDHTGSCSYGPGGQKTEFTGDYQGSAPQECDNGGYVATRVSIQSPLLSGFSASAQCGSYTISVLILGGAGTNATQQAADSYLNSAVERLRLTLVQP